MKYLHFVIFLAITLVQAISSAALPAPELDKHTNVDGVHPVGVMDAIQIPPTKPTTASLPKRQTPVYGIPMAGVAPSTERPAAVFSAFIDPSAEAVPKKSQSNTIPVNRSSLPMLTPAAEHSKGSGSNLISGSSSSAFIFLPEMPWMPSFEPLGLFASMRSHLEPIRQRLGNMLSLLSGGLLGGFADEDINPIQRTEPVTPETSGYPLSEFEDISNKDIPADAPENKGYLVHYSDSGRKWRTKNKDIIDQILSGDDSLIADGHTEYTSSNENTSFYRTHLVIVNGKVVSDPANLTDGGKILPFYSGLHNSKSKTAAFQPEIPEKPEVESKPEIPSTKANESEKSKMEANSEIPLAKADKPGKSMAETNPEIPLTKETAEFSSGKSTPIHPPVENESNITLTHPPMKNKDNVSPTHPPVGSESNDSSTSVLDDNSDEEIENISNVGNADSNLNKDKSPPEVGNSNKNVENSSPNLITNSTNDMGNTISKTVSSNGKSGSSMTVGEDLDASFSSSYSVSSGE